MAEDNMSRGKRQIIFEYLPEAIFDYDKRNLHARVEKVTGTTEEQLNKSLIIRAIDDYVTEWQNGTKSHVFDSLDSQSFVLKNPSRVVTRPYPEVFWCQNPDCQMVVDFRNKDFRLGSSGIETECPNCGGELTQMRFVRFHRCGYIEPLTPRFKTPCEECGGEKFALIEQGGQRIQDLKWQCMECGRTSEVVRSAYCPECDWEEIAGEEDNTKKRTRTNIFRANEVFYTHYRVLLNHPTQELDPLFRLSEWEVLPTAKYLQLEGTKDKTLLQLAEHNNSNSTTQTKFTGQTTAESLREKGYSDEEIEKFRDMKKDLLSDGNSAGLERLKEKLIQRSGLDLSVIQRSGRKMLESVYPLETGHPESLAKKDSSERTPSQERGFDIASNMGLADIILITDFPITLASFGFSRQDREPDECKLHPFPQKATNSKERYPIYVDLTNADALMIRLDPVQVLQWIEDLGYKPELPDGDKSLAASSYFIKLFDNSYLRSSIEEPVLRLVFGLLHTMSHIFLERTALLCGLNKTSISEYILPRTLSFMLYSSQRFGATIGAMHSLFQQSLGQLLKQAHDSKHCVYDPVCKRRGGSCHACVHLPETSCSFFNLNLSRSFIFGGYDKVLGEIDTGYMDTDFNE